MSGYTWTILFWCIFVLYVCMCIRFGAVFLFIPTLKKKKKWKKMSELVFRGVNDRVMKVWELLLTQITDHTNKNSGVIRSKAGRATTCKLYCVSKGNQRAALVIFVAHSRQGVVMGGNQRRAQQRHPRSRQQCTTYGFNWPFHTLEIKNTWKLLRCTNKIRRQILM